MTGIRTRGVALALAAVAALAWVTLVSPEDGGAATPTGVTTRSSVRDDGTQSPTGGGQSEISGNGRYQIFVSPSDLNPAEPGNGTQGCGDCGDERANYGVYVRDLVAKHTDQVSYGAQRTLDPTKPTADQPDGDSDYGSISANGRYLAFATQATNVVYPNDDRDTEQYPTAIVVCDRGAPDANGVYAAAPAAGAVYPVGAAAGFRCYTVADVSTDLTYLQNYAPHLSANGRRIVWGDYPDDFGNVHALALTYSSTGVLQPPQPANIRNFGGETDGPIPVGETGVDYYSYVQPQVSADGDWLVMQGFRDSTQAYTIVEADLATTPALLRRVDVKDFDGDTPVLFGEHDDPPAHPAVSGDGSVVAFDIDDFPGRTDNDPQVYVVDVDADDEDFAATETPVESSQLASFVGGKKGGDGDGAYPALSADGRYVAFVTDHPGMWVGATGPTSDVSCLSPRGTVEGPEASPSASGSVTPSPTPTPSTTPSTSPSPSGSSSGPTRQRTVCQVVAQDLIAGDPSATDEPAPKAELATPSVRSDCEGATAADVCPGNAASTYPLSMSADGGRLAFDSDATDLSTGTDTNKNTDAFVRQWQPTVTGTPLQFGTVVVGKTADKDITLTVTGFGPVPIGPVSVSGPAGGDYTIDDTQCDEYYDGEPLHSDESCFITVSFTPTTLGDRPATVTVSTPAAPGQPSTTVVTVPVDGTGGSRPSKPPAFASDPTHLDFGSSIPDRPGGTTRTLTLSNPGGSTLTISSVAVVDAAVPGAKGDYSLDTSDCGAGPTLHLAAGASCTVTVVWTGHAVGSRNASLVVTASAPVGTRTIPLLATVPKPTILVNPAVLAGGHVTTVSGEGFAPDAQVDITVPFSDDVLTTTGSSGRFSTDLLVLHESTLGPRNVVATMPGLDKSITAHAPLLIVLGSQQGPVLVDRH